MMSTNTSDDREAGVIASHENNSETVDPRDTDHPTGATQAAENAAEESPS